MKYNKIEISYFWKSRENIPPKHEPLATKAPPALVVLPDDILSMDAIPAQKPPNCDDNPPSGGFHKPDLRPNGLGRHYHETDTKKL
jgi:hypothetical protein